MAQIMTLKVSEETRNKIIEEILSEDSLAGSDFKSFLSSMGIKLEKEELIEGKSTIADLIHLINIFIKARDQKQLTALSRFNLKTIDYSIIDQVLFGRSNKEIAAKVLLSEKAVKYHLSKNFKKFDVKNREELRIKLKKLLKLGAY